MRLRDDQRIGLVSALLLMGLTLGTGIMVYEVMESQVEVSLGKGLEMTLQEDVHHLITGLEDAKEDTQGVSWILCKRNSLMLRHPIAELNSKTIKRSFPVSYWQRPFPADILLC